jgi:hypothetical protein
MNDHKEDAGRLLLEMASAAVRANRQMEAQRQVTESWNGTINVEPYKRSNAWPGNKYCLMGNSFNVEIRNAGPQYRLNRVNAVHELFSVNNAHCLTLNEVFSNDKFVKSLSRFERDWLSRLSPETMIGIAYDACGNRIEEAFSVWRKDFVPTHNRKVLVTS